MNQIKTILERTYNDLSLRRNIIPLFLGNPGIGKTQIIYQFAKEKGVNIVEFIASTRSPFEISGLAMPDTELKRMTIFDFDEMLNLKDGDILFLDELGNGNPATLNACLVLLEQRKFLSGKPLPDIMIVAAANSQGMSPMTPQVKERFVWYNITFNANTWVNDYMIPKYNITSSMGDKLSNLIKNEDFKGQYNYNTPRSIDKAIESIIKDLPTPYENRLYPILHEMIYNTSDEPIVLKNNELFIPGQGIPWLILIKNNEITTK